MVIISVEGDAKDKLSRFLARGLSFCIRKGRVSDFSTFFATSSSQRSAKNERFYQRICLKDCHKL